MGIPREDQADYMCRQDMNAIENAVREIRTAMTNVDAMLPKTWIGKKADNWRTDHEGRMRRLKTLFDSFPAEERRLVEKAQQEEAKRRKQSLGL
ncbi:hypothetical protein ACWGDE_27690 [Streptomyces sp. NPDC054956]